MSAQPSTAYIRHIQQTSAISIAGYSARRMQAVATRVVTQCVCLSVCVLVALVSIAKNG